MVCGDSWAHNLVNEFSFFYCWQYLWTGHSCLQFLYSSTSIFSPLHRTETTSCSIWSDTSPDIASQLPELASKCIRIFDIEFPPIFTCTTPAFIHKCQQNKSLTDHRKLQKKGQGNLLRWNIAICKVVCLMLILGAETRSRELKHSSWCALMLCSEWYWNQTQVFRKVTSPQNWPSVFSWKLESAFYIVALQCSGGLNFALQKPPIFLSQNCYKQQTEHVAGHSNTCVFLLFRFLQKSKFSLIEADTQLSPSV